MSERTFPDGGYGWIVVICTGFIAGVCTGLMKCSGQIYTEMLSRNTNYSNQLAAILILPRVLGSVFSIFSNKLAEIYSFKFTIFIGSCLAASGMCLSSLAVDDITIFMLTYGVLVGLGNACFLTPSTIVTGLYFAKRRSLAMSTSTTIAGVIGFSMPILVKHLLTIYALQGALLILGGIFLQNCITAMMIRQPNWALVKPPNNKTTIDILKQIFIQLFNDCRHFTNVTFILLLFNRIAFFFAFVSHYLFLPQFALEQIEGITKTQTAYLLSVTFIGEVVCRWLAGLVNNFLPKHKTKLYLISLFLMAISVLSFQFTANFTSILLVSIAYGIFNGYAFVSYFLVMFDTFGPKETPGANAIHHAITGLCLLSAGPIMVWIRDVTGSYRHCFTFLASFLGLSVLGWGFKPLISRCTKEVL